MENTLFYTRYRAVIEAAWTGKLLGGIIGAPYECHKRFQQETAADLWPAQIYPNDDLDIQVVFLEALQAHGVFPDSRMLARYWQQHCFYVCCEYGTMIDNLELGILPPLSGSWNNNTHHSSMGCPIRSELWGLISPGNPELAAQYAAQDGCIDHGPVSVDLECFLSAMTAEAFFVHDIGELFDRALNAVPAQSIVREIVPAVRQLAESEKDIHQCWLELIRRWGHRNATYAPINVAFSLLALLRGRDFKEVMKICVQCGWDVDCTAATAGALYAMIYGIEALPQDWLNRMGKELVCACEIPHQHARISDFSEETARIGVEVARLRNFRINFQDAPEVPLRPLPASVPEIRVEYPEAPVLWGSIGRTTPIILTLRNPTSQVLKGELKITADAPVTCSPQKFPAIELAPGESCDCNLAIAFRQEEKFLPRQNILHAELVADGKIEAECTFGLEGAQQFTVYGPYWDMFDHERFEECPFCNARLTCNPGNLPGNDALDEHVRLDYEYLNETRLLQEDLPEEFPVHIENGGILLPGGKISRFKGTACYYLVQTICSRQELHEVIAGVGYAFPCRVWFDGKLILDNRACHCLTAECLDQKLSVTLSGKPQRLVMKLAVKADEFALETFWFKPTPGFQKAYSPFVHVSSLCKINENGEIIR